MALDLKYRLAELGYNMGYGAKRQFASYDLVEKFPFYFTVFTFAVGIFTLAYPEVGTPKWLSIGILVFSYIMTSVNSYSKSKEGFIESGKRIQECYGRIRNLYIEVDSKEASVVFREMEEIEAEYHKVSLHKQVFGSDIYAHFKLFGESQSKWFVKELKLKFWRDMVPAALYKFIFMVIVILLVSGWLNSEMLDEIISCMKTGRS